MRWALVLLLLLAGCGSSTTTPPVVTPPGTMFQVTVVVMDVAGVAIAGANVTVGNQFSATTNAAGFAGFRISHGDYRIVVTAEGFVSSGDIPLTVDRNIHRDIKLTRAKESS